MITYAFDSFGASGAGWRQEGFKASFTVKLLRLFDKAYILQLTKALLHRADKMIRTPSKTQSRYELATMKNKMIEIIEKNFLGELDLETRLFEHLKVDD